MSKLSSYILGNQFKELGMEGMNGHIYGSPFGGFSTSSKESIEWE
jgi:hypothetical protein